MTAMYGINSINLPHVDLYKWASKKNIFLPYNFKKTPEQEAMFLKILAMRQYFVKMSPAQDQARMAEAVQEAMKYYPVSGLSDRAVMIFQLAGAIFFAVITVMKIASSKL